MEKHSSFHLYSGNGALAKEIKHSNSAALLGNMNRLHKCDSPGSLEGRHVPAVHMGSRFGLDTEGHRREWLQIS